MASYRFVCVTEFQNPQSLVPRDFIPQIYMKKAIDGRLVLAIRYIYLNLSNSIVNICF